MRGEVGNPREDAVMIRNALFVVIVAALAATGHSQTTAKRKTGPAEVEVTFANGSLVKMALLAENIDIDTEYGKLSVPVRDVRRIEFGLRLPEGADKKIETAVKQLASTEYKEREGAVRELVAQGIYAYPALLQAARKGEPEVAKRAQDAIAKIKAHVPAKEFRLGPDDKILTPRFTIVGRITTGSLRAKSEYFGDVDLALATLRHVRLLVETRDTEVVIDAAKYALPNQWLDTGIMLESTANLTIIAGGEIELRPTAPGTYVCGPRGFGRAPAAPGGFAPAAAKKMKGGGVWVDGPIRAYPGTLIGRVGENGETFVIGDRFDGPPEREGKLYLQIMSSPYDNGATGSYQVKVLVRD
jgi:hypothetical protein